MTPVKRSSRRSGKRSWRSYVGTIIVTILAIFIVTALAGSSLLYYLLLKELPSIAALKDYRPSITTRVYAENNELIDEFFLEDRKVIKYENIPKIVINAFVASEDARFFQHKGFDMQSMSRAFFKNIEAGKIVQGGEHHHPAGRQGPLSLLREELYPQTPGGPPGLQDRQVPDQRGDHHPLPEPHLPGSRNLRHRGGSPGVLREDHPGTDPR